MFLTKTSALKTLGLSSGANEDQIKKAYRKLAMVYHPDRNLGEGAIQAEQKFKEIKAAYEFLTSPSSKHSFSEAGDKRNGNPFYSKPFYGDYYDDEKYAAWADELDDILKKYDGGYKSTITISLEEAFSGKIDSYRFSIDGQFADCNIAIPAGVVQGQKISTLKLFGKNLDIFVNIDTKNRTVTWATTPNLYSGGIEGSGNIEESIEVSWADIMLGRYVPYKTIDGKDIEVRILPGIEAGKRIKLKDRGYWKDSHRQNRGDVFLKIVPVVPKIEDINLDDLREVVAKSTLVDSMFKKEGA